MAQLNKSALQVLMNAKLPDNVAQDISPEDLRDVLTSMIDSANNQNDAGIEEFTTIEQTELENLVIAILLLTNFPAYAELYRQTDSAQVLPLAGEALSFDAEGEAVVLEYVGSSIKIISSVGATDFNVRFEGSVSIDNATTITLWLRVNGINTRQLGQLMPSNNAVDGFSFGAFAELDDEDLVQIFAIPSANNKLFDTKIGARLTIQRI